MSIAQVEQSFTWLSKSLVTSYRDIASSHNDFRLTLSDCWRSLERAKNIGWLALPRDNPQVWGQINLLEYKYYDNPIFADLHCVVPGKVAAFSGPRDLGNLKYFDDHNGCRYFSPLRYRDIFLSINVSDVVRLNESQYDASVFEDSGLSVHNLEFPDCTNPPDRIVRAFMRVMDNSTGLVAVHCKAGLGRTGTLIALYLMRMYSFSAREAIAWMRIMRPGSVIDCQQHYLCGVEQNMNIVRRVRAVEGSGFSNLSEDPVIIKPPISLFQGSS